MKADDLFSGDAPPAPPPDPLFAIRLQMGLAGALNVLGPFICITSVPGALLSLWAWYRADEELAKVDNGALPESFRAKVRIVRSVAFANISLASALMSLQMFLFTQGVYAGAVQWVADLWAALTA